MNTENYIVYNLSRIQRSAKRAGILPFRNETWLVCPSEWDENEVLLSFFYFVKSDKVI